MLKKKKTPVKAFKKTGRRYEESIRLKIIDEIQSSGISMRKASRDFGINRRTLDSWLSEYKFTNLKQIEIDLSRMPEIENEKADQKLLKKQVLELTRALGKAKLKISSLEELIVVTEERLKVKITKKAGTRQSKE